MQEIIKNIRKFIYCTDLVKVHMKLIVLVSEE
jgi:hypothetical protein